MTPGVEAFSPDSSIDIACHDGNDINAAAAECNKYVFCKSFILVYNFWNGRCLKTAEHWTNLNKDICFYKKTGKQQQICLNQTLQTHMGKHTRHRPT
jgi:hypothetical protein